MAVRSDFLAPRWPAYVAAGPFLFFSGQLGMRTRGGDLCMRYDNAGAELSKSSAFSWVSALEAPVGTQAIAIYERYRAMLKKQRGDLSHLLRYHIYQRDKHFFSVFDRTRRTYETAPPASTAVGMGRFEPSDTAALCVDAIALRPAAVRALGPREVRRSSSGHLAAAHFSHVIGAGHFLFVAGQIPLDSAQSGSPLIRNYDDIPEAGRFLRVGRSHEDTRNGPIAAQTWFTYDLIRQHLEAAGSSLDAVLNLTVYLQDMRDFATFHRVHEHFFKSGAPALTVVEVEEVGHKGTLIEIEPTAVIPGKRARREIVNPQGWSAPAQMNALVEAGGLAFLSGIPGTGADGTPISTVRELPAAMRSSATRCIADNPCALQLIGALAELAKRLAAAGKSLRDVAQLTVYLDNIDEFRAIEPLLVRALGKWRPALTVLEVPSPSPVRGARVSLTAIAWCGGKPKMVA